MADCSRIFCEGCKNISKILYENNWEYENGWESLDYENGWDIIKATHSYLGTKKKGIDRHEALLALHAVNVRWEGVVSLGQ